MEGLLVAAAFIGFVAVAAAIIVALHKPPAESGPVTLPFLGTSQINAMAQRMPRPPSAQALRREQWTERDPGRTNDGLDMLDPLNPLSPISPLSPFNPVGIFADHGSSAHLPPADPSPPASDYGSALDSGSVGGSDYAGSSDFGGSTFDGDGSSDFSGSMP